MKKRIIVALTAIVIICLVVTTILFLKSRNRENIGSLLKAMGYESTEKMIKELSGKPIYVSDGKIIINDINTEIDSSEVINEKENVTIDGVDVKNNKLTIICSNRKRIFLVDLPERDEKKVIKDDTGEGEEKVTVDTESMMQSDNSEEDNSCELVIAKKKAYLGDTVEIPIQIKNNPGVLGMTISIVYDEQSLELKDIKSGEVFNGILQFNKPKVLENGCTCMWDGVSIEKEDIKDGVMATLVFEIKKNAQNKLYSLSVECGGNDVVNNNLQSIDVKVKKGHIKVNE